MNRRIRQKIRALQQRQNMDILATIQNTDGTEQVTFVSMSEVQKYREQYGDRIKFWGIDPETVLISKV